MESIISKLIAEGEVHTFKNNSYEVDYGTYGRTSCDMLAWVSKVEKFIISNYGAISTPHQLLETRSELSPIDGGLEDDFNNYKRIIVSALVSCFVAPLSNNAESYDVFISHASEDKDDIVRPLAAQLEKLGVRVWFDECQLTLGDSIRRSIDRGLMGSKFGVIILSPSFFSKEWPNKELDALVSREDGSSKVILPVWHRVTAVDISRFSPILADKISVSTLRGVEYVAKSILEAINKSEKLSRYVEVDAASHESEILYRLRIKLLTADTLWQLRQVKYELEDHMSRYPFTPEGRLLMDQVALSLHHQEENDREERSLPAARALGNRLGTSTRYFLYLAIAVILGFVACFVFLNV